MIQINERIWIGDSSVSWRKVRETNIRGILNSAVDLRGVVGWPDMEYMQVGLVDGPGNAQGTYYAAVMALAALVSKNRTLVCCHTGSRSVVVVAMYLNITAGMDWDGIMTLINERVDAELPTPHEAHVKAFNSMNWKVLANIMQS